MPAVIVTLLSTLLLGAAILGTEHRNFALWKFVVFGLPFLGFSLAFLFTRDRLRFLLLSATLALPFLGLKVPPASLGLTVFDVLSIPAAVVLLGAKIGGQRDIDLFPTHGAVLALFLLVPSVAMSISHGNSIASLIVIGELYLFFVILTHYMKDEEVLARLHLNLSIGLILICLFVFIEKATGINFNFGAAHSGQFMQVEQLKVHRVAGIFQDPQKAAQFIAVIMTYLAVLNGHGVFANRRYLLFSWLAVILAVPALLITVSRAAIFGGLLMTTIGLLVFNRRGVLMRLFLGFSIALVVTVVSVVGVNTTLRAVFPESVVKRFELADREMEGRTKIWQESWRIFRAYPVAGVGPGNYREFLMQENPRLRQFYANGGFVPDMPENGYLKILYEVGLLGTLGCLWFVGHLLARMLADIVAGRDQRTASLSLAAGAALVVFLITFLTIFTVSDMRNALIVPFLAAAVFSGRGRQSAQAAAETDADAETNENCPSLVPLC